MTLNYIWWWGSGSGDLEYSSITTTPRFTLIQSSSIFKAPYVVQIDLFKDDSYSTGLCTSTFSFLSRGIILWIELPWPENLANTYAWHVETLDSCFDLIRSHQLCIPWSPPLEIEPATTGCRAKTLQLSHESISHTSDTILPSHCNCAAN